MQAPCRLNLTAVYLHYSLPKTASMKTGTVVKYSTRQSAVKRGASSKTVKRYAKVIAKDKEKTTLAMPIREKGKLVMKIIEVLNELIPDAIEQVNILTDYIKKLFQKLPNEIHLNIDGELHKFILTERKSFAASLDSVSYERLSNYTPVEKGDLTAKAHLAILHWAEGESLSKARAAMKELLRSKSIL